MNRESPISEYPIIVFSDLDGSLLDHESYDHAPAQEALDVLRDLEIPVVLSTSKTFEEVLAIMDDLDISAPFIIENGGALVIPADNGFLEGSVDEEYEEIALATDVSELSAWLSGVCEAQDYKIKSMLDMSVQEIMEYTGLEPGEAERAAMRRYTIPLVWQDDAEPLDDFVRLVQEQGWRLLKGGRFYHLQGQTDKSRAMLECIHRFKEQGWENIISIALGDSANDSGMLEKCDYAIVIPQTDGGHLKLSRKEGVIVAGHPGPVGWNESLLLVLKQIQGQSGDSL